MTDWNILCPGKGLRPQSGEIDLGLPTIAVNGAIGLERLGVTRPERLYWCAADRPSRHQHNREAVLRLSPTLIVRRLPARGERAWADFGSDVFEIDGGERMPATFKKRLKRLGARKVPPMGAWCKDLRSIVYALCAPLLIDGPAVGTVTLWGASMTGEGNFDAVTGEEVARYDGTEMSWDARWDHERAILREAEADLAKFGVTLVNKPAATSMLPPFPKAKEPAEAPVEASWLSKMLGTKGDG